MANDDPVVDAEKLSEKIYQTWLRKTGRDARKPEIVRIENHEHHHIKVPFLVLLWFTLMFSITILLGVTYATHASAMETKIRALIRWQAQQHEHQTIQLRELDHKMDQQSVWFDRLSDILQDIEHTNRKCR